MEIVRLATALAACASQSKRVVSEALKVLIDECSDQIAENRFHAMGSTPSKALKFNAIADQLEAAIIAVRNEFSE